MIDEARKETITWARRRLLGVNTVQQPGKSDDDKMGCFNDKGSLVEIVHMVLLMIAMLKIMFALT
ncbi:unnamed protein product [Kuraishia capsulata CBS 1993]|uniref:Uncharacterized protein n=1 Tax=Kuraishia capsulata CBS 1993 TaxID=1382522 RepID=W6MNX8_9ASCO|nr:uncharacterized protein KUCA_T00003958001 [Kuraishia capsulata CBS 1993]CDK27978.1 unnamed protein product [Kuraishia capsulata CBS 1993]